MISVYLLLDFGGGLRRARRKNLKELEWTGWHPFCRCFATAIIADEKQRDAYYEANAAGEDVEGWEFEGAIKDMPEGWNNWVADNEERIARAKSMPYFIRDNFKDGDVTKGLRWEEAIKADTQAAEERMAKAVEFVKKQNDLDSKEYWTLYNNWDNLTDAERLLALERAKVTGVVDMESLDMSPTILQRVGKKEILDFIDEDLENLHLFGEKSVEDSLHYIVARDSGKIEYIDVMDWEGGRKLAGRKDIKWACTNKGMPAYGDCYWTRDKEAMAHMLKYIGGAQFEEGKLITNIGAMYSNASSLIGINLEGFNMSVLQEAISFSHSFGKDLESKVLDAFAEHRVYGAKPTKLIKKNLRIGRYAINRSNEFESVITISTRDNEVIINGQKAIFNASRHLEEALKRMKDKGAWDMQHEYAIETLWHEIMHNGTMRIDRAVVKPSVEGESLLETIHQFCARRSYRDFMHKLTGQWPKYAEQVMEEGFGYNLEVSNFRKILAHVGVSDKEAFGYISSQLTSTGENSVVDMVAKYLAKNTGRDIEWLKSILCRIGVEDIEDVLPRV